MSGSHKKFILILIFTVWLLPACQVTDDWISIGNNPTATGPLSLFVPEHDKISTEANQSVTLESRHVSTEGLTKLEIWVDDTPVNVALPAEYSTIFTNDADNIQIWVDSPHLEANSVKPEYPANDEWIVSLVWIGRLPGTYDLKLVATDGLGNKGDSITQPIEVK